MYPHDWKHGYSDGSAEIATFDAGIGQYPNRKRDTLADVRGNMCSHIKLRLWQHNLVFTLWNHVY